MSTPVPESSPEEQEKLHTCPTCGATVSVASSDEGTNSYVPADRALVLSLLASLTLADNMGDVGGEVSTVLRRLGIPEQEHPNGEGNWWDDVRYTLAQLGVRTLYGTEISDDDE